LETIVGNPGCQPGLATSFQLLRLVGCGFNSATSKSEPMFTLCLTNPGGELRHRRTLWTTLRSCTGKPCYLVAL